MYISVYNAIWCYQEQINDHARLYLSLLFFPVVLSIELRFLV